MDLNQYYKDLEYLVNIDSGQDCHEGITQVAEFFKGKFDELGWNTVMHDLEPNTGACLICTNREADHYDLMMIGHTDTVFQKGTAAERPFRMDETKAYGPGVADMKNGSLMMYYVIKDLPKEVTDKLNIVVVFNPDEEIGSRWSRELFFEYAKKTKYVYVYESQSGDGTRCIQRKGSLSFSVEINGKAGHVGYTFTNGSKSAVVEMARWILRLNELQSVEHNLNVNLARVYGGDKMNVIPDKAGFNAHMRIPNYDEVERVKAELELLKTEAAERGYSVEIPTWSISAPFLQSEEGMAYADHVKEVAASIGQEFKTKFRGGLSDANRIVKYGPICIDGMGTAGELAHSPDEFMLLDSVIPTFELSTALIKDLAQSK